MKTLYLLRHAKAAPYAASGEDHDRPLSDKGRLRAGLIADYMQRAGLDPQIVLTSTSLRTLETVEELKPALPPAVQIKALPQLYLADARDILNEIWSLDDSESQALLVGHNPGFHELAFSLAGPGNRDLMEKLSMKFPTAAFAALSFEADAWSDIDPGKGHLDRLVFPSDLKD